MRINRQSVAATTGELVGVEPVERRLQLVDQSVVEFSRRVDAEFGAAEATTPRADPIAKLHRKRAGLVKDHHIIGRYYVAKRSGYHRCEPNRKRPGVTIQCVRRKGQRNLGRRSARELGY